MVEISPGARRITLRNYDLENGQFLQTETPWQGRTLQGREVEGRGVAIKTASGQMHYFVPDNASGELAQVQKVGQPEVVTDHAFEITKYDSKRKVAWGLRVNDKGLMVELARAVELKYLE